MVAPSELHPKQCQFLEFCNQVPNSIPIWNIFWKLLRKRFLHLHCIPALFQKNMLHQKDALFNRQHHTTGCPKSHRRKFSLPFHHRLSSSCSSFSLTLLFLSLFFTSFTTFSFVFLSLPRPLFIPLLLVFLVLLRLSIFLLFPSLPPPYLFPFLFLFPLPLSIFHL